MESKDDVFNEASKERVFVVFSDGKLKTFCLFFPFFQRAIDNRFA